MDYLDQLLDRLTTFFRLFLVIPIAIVLGAVDGGVWQWTSNGRTLVVILAWFAILFTGHYYYPRELF